jgi:hypothetical protein
MLFTMLSNLVHVAMANPMIHKYMIFLYNFDSYINICSIYWIAIFSLILFIFIYLWKA